MHIYLHSDPRTGSGLSTDRTLLIVSAVPPLRVITSAQEPAEKPVTVLVSVPVTEAWRDELKRFAEALGETNLAKDAAKDPKVGRIGNNTARSV